jgi:GT2 family glycosyltransferase
MADLNNVAPQHACRQGPPRYLHMLNPDTIVRERAIGALFRFLETHPKARIAGSGLENPDGSSLTVKRPGGHLVGQTVS